MKRLLALALLGLMFMVSAPASAQVTATIHHERRAVRHIEHRIATLKARKRAHKGNLRLLRSIAPNAPWLASTGACESGGAPGGTYDLRTGLAAYSAAGPFYGRYQFTMSTWASVGGVGDPRYAGWIMQAYRAVLILRRDGNGAWPVCGH